LRGQQRHCVQGRAPLSRLTACRKAWAAPEYESYDLLPEEANRSKRSRGYHEAGEGANAATGMYRGFMEEALYEESALDDGGEDGMMYSTNENIMFNLAPSSVC
jgi:hypothetical protein